MSAPAKKVNLLFRDQTSYLQNLHRSGWPFVMNSLMTLHSDDGIWLDTYVDRSFHWNKTLIPYTGPWIGFVHHTFDTTFSSYNCINLLNNPDFLASLPTCRGLFVFTRQLKERWDTELSKIGFGHVPVRNLVHPTQFVDNNFTMTKFDSNSKKKMVQIGAWLRDNYAVYRLNCGKSPVGSVNKAALRGPQMDNYFKPMDFFRYFRRMEWKNPEIVPPVLSARRTLGEDVTSTTATRIISVNAELPVAVQEAIAESQTGMCRDVICRDSEFGLNKYVAGAVSLLQSYDSSVTVIPTLDDQEYDELLSTNIVFLYLIDAGAVNTVLECIVRNTPVVVNRIPPMVDLLGEGYPLFYDSLDQVPELVNAENIAAAFDHLANMDKTKFSIDTFMRDFVESDVYQAL